MDQRLREDHFPETMCISEAKCPGGSGLPRGNRFDTVAEYFCGIGREIQRKPDHTYQIRREISTGKYKIIQYQQQDYDGDTPENPDIQLCESRSETVLPHPEITDNSSEDRSEDACKYGKRYGDAKPGEDHLPAILTDEVLNKAVLHGCEEARRLPF